MKAIYSFFAKLFLFFFVSSHLAAQTAGPISDFSASADTICVGEEIQFTDLSQNNPTSWNWTFNGGSPTTSTLQNPMIVFNFPGKYNVLLTSSNSAGSNTKGSTSLICVVLCTKINEYQDDANLRIYPNPTQSFINVVSSSDAKFSLFNALGGLLTAGNLKKEEISKVNLEKFSAGVYFFRLEEGTRTKNYKIIKE